MSIEIVIKHHEQALPPLADGELRYVVAANGLFLERATPMYETSCRVERCAAGLARHEHRCRLRCPALPATLACEMLDFFRWAYSWHGGEAVLVLLHDPTRQVYRWHCPPQRVEVYETWSGSWYAAGEIEYTDPVELPRGFVVFGDAHSHASMGAQPSVTDHNDERHKDGLHIIVGHLHRRDVELSLDFVMDGRRFRVDPSSILPELQEDRDGSFPEQWRDRVEIVKRPYVDPWRRGEDDGRYGYTRSDDGRSS